MDLHNVRIAVVGCGNMGASLIEGLLAVGLPTAHVLGVEPDSGRRLQMSERFGIHTCADPTDRLAEVDVAVLAVKPQQIEQTLASLIQREKPVPVLSIAAGVPLERLHQGAGGVRRVVRAMPNLACRVRAGVTALYSDLPPRDPLCRCAESIMRAVGTVVWVRHEGMMDAVTAVSGCGPAYFFLLMELIERHALELGLERREARHLALQSAFGAAKMAVSGDTDPRTLRREVSSPGGATEAAIAVLLEGGLDTLVAEALQAAHRRAGELAHPATPPT